MGRRENPDYYFLQPLQQILFAEEGIIAGSVSRHSNSIRGAYDNSPWAFTSNGKPRSSRLHQPEEHRAARICDFVLAWSGHGDAFPIPNREVGALLEDVGRRT